MEIMKNVEVDLKSGKIVLAVDIAALLVPVVDGIKAKIEAGEIDLIKGTDLDKEAMLKAIDFLKAELVK